jgi:hypothetical protein
MDFEDGPFRMDLESGLIPMQSNVGVSARLSILTSVPKLQKVMTKLKKGLKIRSPSG